ncbi:MAG: response regulator transcription factor [Collimonas sp.]|uniref:response regulator transcription factor n=1 Tax=Collimonas sp. TaxID=1963772 RepID=UPI0032673F79
MDDNLNHASNPQQRPLTARPVVLIVDDIPDNLALLSDALDESGHIVLVATDGASALERLSYITPDLILLDAIMPGLDGFETCRRIKLLGSASHVPVVFMTGLTETEHVVKGFQVGGIDYVTKPIRPQEIVARVAAHIRTARMMAQARDVIDAAAHAVIVLGTDGAPLWQTGKASFWLEKYFPRLEQPGRKLPPQLQFWLNQNLVLLRQTTHSPQTLVIGGDDGELIINLSKNAQSAELTLLMEEKSFSLPTAMQLEAYHLTPRETDVLAWVSKGKTNRDIAEILGMSPRTVNKHLEHIYIKLGVETRAAAAAMAISKQYDSGHTLQ